jgi:tetratricopeptide (TPR) repeat protein
VLAPSNPNLYIAYSQLLATTGRTEDAVKAAQQAKELDAVSPVVNNLLALAYLWDGDNVRAAEQFAIAAEGGFNNLRNPGYLIFLMREQRFVEARQFIASYYANSDADPRWLMDNIQPVATYTDDDELVAAAAEAVATGNVPPRFQLGLWLLLDQPEQVYETVHRFWNQLDFVLLLSREGEKFRDSDEFAQIVKETGLDAYWEHYQGPDDHGG